MPAIPVISAVTAVGGLALQAKGASDARKAAQQAANTPAPTVDIAALQRQAQQVAAENAARSAELEAQYNPGAAELRRGGLASLIAGLNVPQTERDALAARIAQQAGQPLGTVGIPEAQQFESALTRQVVEAAARDLEQGGALPQDVRNLVARRALATSGTVSGGLRLGRDLTARDLGLTSLDIYNQRLRTAQQVAQQEAALEQANAALRAQNQGLGLQAQGMNLESERFARGNLFDSASFLDRMASGDFGRALAAAQLGQNIAQPASGLDPGSIANLAVANVNAQAQQQQQANALRVADANQRTQLGGQLFGTGLGFASQFFKPKTPAISGFGGTAGNASTMLGALCWVARECFGQDNPEWIAFRDWMLRDGSPELVGFYAENGRYIAEQIRDQPAVKTLIKHLMIAAKGGGN